MRETLLTAGTPAPDFTLPATPDGRPVSLGDLPAGPLVLAFYPADWSPVCGDQLALYSEAADQLAGYGATLVGVSADGPWCHRAYAGAKELRLTLLSDFEPKGAVARRYGCYDGTRGVAGRALFVLDADRVVRWSYLSPDDVNPGLDGILSALGRLTGRAAPARHGLSADTGHSRGPTTAPVHLVEYGDYQCPHCRAAHAELGRLLPAFGYGLRFTFRNFPLARVHPHAELAAEAAEAAAAQGGFWPMHDGIFDHQDELGPDMLLGLAAGLGLDAGRVAADLRARVWRPRVAADFEAGVAAGVNGTPTFFVSGRRHDGPPEAEALAEAVRAAARAGAVGHG